MARPKKEAAESKTIPVGFLDYCRMQNFLAQHLQIQQSMAGRMMTAASSQLAAINATLSQVQSNTRSSLALSSIGDKEISSEEFPHIHNLLMTDTSLMTEPTEGLGDFQLPLAPPLPTPAKKQRKQRAPKDPNAPKRPVTAFFLFLAENKEATRKSLGPNAKPGEVQQHNKDKWNSLAEEKQEKYKQKYREHFDEYKAALSAYKAKGGQVDPNELEEVPEDDADAIPTDTEAAKASESSSDSSDEDDEESDSDSSEAPSPQKPKKDVKVAKSAAKPSKEPSPEKKKKAEKEDKKKKKAEKEKKVSPVSSPEPPSKKKRKAEVEAEAGTDEKKKKKKRKSQGYAGNSNDF